MAVQVSGPADYTVTGLKLLRGTVSYYHFVVQLPAMFYDQVTVGFTVSPMLGVQQLHAAQAKSLSWLASLIEYSGNTDHVWCRVT